ncbi:MAG: B3/B4 domain-containing protein, partial [Candidatus Bathyarchaeia archaeon]
MKDEPIFRAYRDFFWKIGVDPTKVRPAAEALVRRALLGKPIPTINTLVDAYNLASMETGIALAAFDRNKISGDLVMRYAWPGEPFQGIGMRYPIVLRGVEVVVSDGEKLVAIYPYRDADSSKIVESTRSLILMVCGVPGIEETKLIEARDIATSYITRFCDGEV